MKIILITLLLSGCCWMLQGETMVNFHDAGLVVVGNEKTRRNISSSIETLPGDKKNVVLHWGQGCFDYVQMNVGKPATKPLAEFKHAEFILHLNAPENTQVNNIALRFMDSKGEIFQIKSVTNPLTLNQKTEQLITYTFNTASRQESWGKDADKKIDWPLSFMGIACTFLPGTKGGKLYFNFLELQFQDAAFKAVSFDIDTGHPIHLLLPDSTYIPKIRFKNNDSRDLDFSAEVKFEDFNRKGFTKNFDLHLPANGNIDLKISECFESLGIWNVSYTLRKKWSDAVFSGKRSMVIMTPAGPTNEKSSGFMFGVCSHPERVSKDQQELEALAAGLCGIKFLRSDCVWQYIQPEKNKWNFDVLDHLVDIFGRQGVELMPLLTYTPKWAVAKDWKPYYTNKTYQLSFARPDYNAYAEFAGKMAGRYKNKVRFFEVWNEPDSRFANFSIEEYLELQKRGYVAVKNANPAATVFTAGFTCAPDGVAWTYKPDMIKRTLYEGKGSFDILAFHGHGSFNHYATQILRIKDIQNKLKSSEPWYANETAFSSAGGADVYQAETLFKKLIFSWSEGAVGYNWYDLRNDGYDPYNGEHNYGMLTRDFYPKAIYPVYNMLATTFRNAVFVERIALCNGIYAWAFKTDDKILIPGWNETGTSSVLAIVETDAESAVLVDMMGNRSHVPIAKQYFLLTPGMQPSTICLNYAKNFKLKGNLVSISDNCLVIPGRESILDLNLFNPFDTTQEFELSTLAITDKIILKSGETKKVQMKIPFSTETLIELQCSLNGNNIKGKLKIPLVVARVIRNGVKAIPDFILDNSSQRVELYPANPQMLHMTWQGPKDLSAKIWMSTADSSLIFNAEVIDDKHFQSFSGSDVWKGDNLQLAFLFKEQNTVWEIGLTRLDSGLSEVMIWNKPPEVDKKVLENITLITRRTDNKTIYQAKIPFKVLGVSQLTLTKGFRFNLIINDNDGNGRKGWLQIAPGIAEKKDSSFFPTVILE